MKNCIFEKQKFIFWFVGKKNIKIYKKISLELKAWKSLVSCSGVKSNTLSKQEIEHIWTCLNCITKKTRNICKIIHYSCLFALLAKIKIWKVKVNFGEDSLKEL